MFNRPDLLRILGNSGLTKIEVALLYGVTRQTVHYWQNTGLPRVGGHTARMAETVTKAILNAMEKGLLPLPAMDDAARKKRIETMARTLQNLKPAPIK